MESILIFAKYTAAAISIAVVFMYLLLFVSTFYRVYTVLHAYLEERGIAINKDLEKRIVKELNIKYPYKKHFTMRIHMVYHIEESILRDIKDNYEQEINESDCNVKIK